MGVSLGRKKRRNRERKERRKVHERQIEGEKDANGDVESAREKTGRSRVGGEGVT